MIGFSSLIRAGGWLRTTFYFGIFADPGESFVALFLMIRFYFRLEAGFTGIYGFILPSLRCCHWLCATASNETKASVSSIGIHSGYFM